MSKLRQYSICDLQDEVRALVLRGAIGRKNRIYELSRHFSERDWPRVERLLELNEFLLRDSVIDLVGVESWVND